MRDLAIFMLDRITARDTGIYGVVGPSEPIAIRDVLETGRDAADANTSLTWASEAFLNGLGDEVQIWFPMWEPGSGAHTYDAGKAVDAGLRHRPFRDTVGDTLAWDADRGPPDLRRGLSAQKEGELLSAAPFQRSHPAPASATLMAKNAASSQTNGTVPTRSKKPLPNARNPRTGTMS